MALVYLTFGVDRQNSWRSIDAIRPVTNINIESYWDTLLPIESVATTSEYKANARCRFNSLRKLDQYQRFWLDAFWLRQK